MIQYINKFYKNSSNTVTVIASNKFSSVSGNVTANNGMFTNVVNVASHTGTIVSITGNITAGGFTYANGNPVTGTQGTTGTQGIQGITGSQGTT